MPDVSKCISVTETANVSVYNLLEEVHNVPLDGMSLDIVLERDSCF